MSLPAALDRPTALPGLRRWQQEALTAYEASGRPDFLVTATPGAGKTRFALALATLLRARRDVERVIVVCPTDHLRTQWAQAAAGAGLVLDPTLSNSVGPVRPDAHGYVTTYAQVAARPALHEARTRGKRSLVILDEIHHAGDGLSWGEAVQQAFTPARRRLALTGTPFRTRADERIPFVRYTDADPADPGADPTDPGADPAGGAADPAAGGGAELRSLADYTYGYREALADGVVRPVVFAAYTGVSRWRNSAGEVVAASLSETSTRSVEATAWRTALDPRGQWVPHVVGAMDDRITQLRAAGMADAAGLLLASDVEDARAYAEVVHRVTGVRPVLITSDDPKASSRIDAFARGTQRIAVCVRMISEGVDVPRAAVLGWLTSYRTPLFFAQAVGRVVRSRRPGESATVFLPAVRPLLTLAAELETERNHVLTPPAPGEDLLDPLPVEQAPGARLTGFEALEASAEFAHVLSAGRAVMPDQPGVDSLSDDDEAFLGLPGLLSAEQTAALLARRDVEVRRRVALSARGAGGDGGAADDDRDRTDPPAAGGGGDAGWAAAVALRREVNGLVAQVAARTGAPHGAVHARLRASVPGPPSAAAPVSVLQARRDRLLSELG